MISSTFHVLLGHPEQETRRRLRQALTTARIAVANVDSCSQAVAYLKKSAFGLLLCHYQLTDRDVWHLLEVVRAGSFCRPDVPAIVTCEPSIFGTLMPLAHDYGARLMVADDQDNLLAVVAEFAAVGAAVRRSVLIIEDIAEAAQLAADALADQYQVEIAPDGEHGLAAWRERRHTIVLLDIQLPGMSGGAVLDRILQEAPNQPVIVFTAYATPERHENFVVDRGAVAFLRKPVSRSRLREACERTLTYQAAVSACASMQLQAARTRQAGHHLWAANLHLQSGQAVRALRHVRRALALNPYPPPSDDDWLQVEKSEN
jgi:CheY-like chemotaxis protein